jgi:hypothetical protein
VRVGAAVDVTAIAREADAGCRAAEQRAAAEERAACLNGAACRGIARFGQAFAGRARQRIGAINAWVRPDQFAQKRRLARARGQRREREGSADRNKLQRLAVTIQRCSSSCSAQP